MHNHLIALKRVSITMGLILGLSAAPHLIAQQKQMVIPFEEVQRFTTAIGQIKNFYVEPVKDQVLFDNAIRGMLSGLDPHSAYLDADEFKELRASTSGQFGGLGIEVGMEDGYVKVISPIDDTPAAKAGIKAGDLIIRLDDTPVKGMTLRDAVKKMRGKVGSKIKLTVFRKSAKKPLVLTITRNIIKVTSIKSRLLDKHYAYIRISHFQEPTVINLKKAILKLRKQAGGKLKGIVVDLRNNPGGLLDSAVQISDTFLDSRKLKNKNIVHTKGRIKGSQQRLNATPGDTSKGVPVVVLINSGSASASEIVAGALQDHNRAVVIGTKSFGKGSVQTVIPIDDKRGIKLTTALYYTPNGRSIQAQGIVPDIEVKAIQIPKKVLAGSENGFIDIKEADLMGHLANGNNKQKDKPKKPASKPAELLLEDYQLHQALNLLKGIHAHRYSQKI